MDGHKSVFGDATNQLDDFKDYLDQQNESADSGLAAIGIGTAKAVTSLGQGLTGFLDIAANLAQVATGVDDQQVRDELAGTRGMVTDVIDFAVNGDKTAALQKLHGAAVDTTVRAMEGDVSAISSVSESVSMLATLRPGAGPRVARGPTVSQSVQAAKQVIQSTAKSKLAIAAGETIERAVIAGGNRATQIANSAASGVRESAKAVAAASRQVKQNVVKTGRGRRSGADDLKALVTNDPQRAFYKIRQMIRSDELDFTTGRDQAVFWSDRNMKRAQAWAARNNKMTLEQTPGGRFLEELDLFGHPDIFDPNMAAKLWNMGSNKFSSAASGVANGFSTGAKRFGPYGERTFWRIEKPILKNNKYVTEFVRRKMDGSPAKTGHIKK